MSRYMIEKVGRNDYNLYRINDDERSDNFLTLELLFPEKIFIEKNNRTFHFSKGDIMKRWNWGDGKPNNECIVEEFPDDDSAMLYFKLGGFDI